MSLFNQPETIDKLFEAEFGPAYKRSLIVHSVELPAYRFVDLYNAAETFVAGREKSHKIETEQPAETLNQLIHSDPPKYSDRSIQRSARTSWHTGVDTQIYLPVDCFWLCPSGFPEECFLVRLSFVEYKQVSRLELACGAATPGEQAVDRIVKHSRTHSIYRNHKLQLSYETGKTDQFGDIEKAEILQVMFSAVEPVTDADIVLSDEHLSVLKRNVIDVQARRKILKANGVPTRRGVLLHGPPGTGKTFACRYLSNKLKDVTRIYVTGASLINVGAIFSLARLLQPSVLFLEDVDLVFAARESNFYSPVLGDLLDHLDGLRANEDISVVLTTNAIDRLEIAIKDRPGRISQCVYMGPPNASLRRRYLEHHLGDRNTEQLDFELLVEISDGATQAFLKEWIHRSVQIACERLDDEGKKADLRNADFETALSEMSSFLEGSDGRIIGFVGLRSR